MFLRGRYWDWCCLTSLSATWTLGLSAPSASLQMTPSRMVQSTHWREGMPSSGTWTGLRGGPIQNSWNSTRPSARSCTWVGAIPNSNTGCVEKGLRVALRRRTWGCWWMRNLIWPSSVGSQPSRPTVSWAASKGEWPAGQGRWFCPSTLPWCDPTWSTTSSCRALSRGRARTCWSGSREGPQRWSEGWNTSPVKTDWESWGCSAWRKEGFMETW